MHNDSSDQRLDIEGDENDTSYWNSPEENEVWAAVKPWVPLASLVLAGILLLAMLFNMASCVGAGLSSLAPAEAPAPAAEQQQEEQPQQQAQPTEGADAQTVQGDGAAPAVKLLDEGRTTDTGERRVSFAAFGDNLANDNILQLADGWAGELEDGAYDFSPLYTNVKKEIGSYDVAFVNQETTLGGDGGGEYEYTGYPSYNTPDTMADAVVEAGFRVINTNSNHTYDWWTGAIEHAQKLWDGYSSVLTIGSYKDQADRDTVRVVECNGVKIAFLSYSYGQNGYDQADLPNDYYAVPFSEEALARDVESARKVADAVVVYLHAGTEYTNEPDEEQTAWARACANNNVDLLIGSHVHVIQPMQYLTRADGGQMLAVYGLGDFVSGYEENPDTILSGEFSCKICLEGGQVKLDDVVWHPLIEHREGDTDTVYLLRDYTADLAKKNELLAGLDSPYNWIGDKTQEVIGNEFKIEGINQQDKKPEEKSETQEEGQEETQAEEA